VQVLHADLVETTYQAALQKAPVAVNGSRMNVAANPFLLYVLDGFVLVALNPSVITSKPAINDHFKTGQRSRAQNMKLFYRDGAGFRKFCSVSP
jgi:hypothetical protein